MTKRTLPGAVVPLKTVLELLLWRRRIAGLAQCVALGGAFGAVGVWTSRANAQSHASETGTDAQPAADERGDGSELTAEAARVTYRAPEECPAAETFRREVDARVDRVWEAPPGALARQVVVFVERAGGGFIARLRFTDALGNAVLRTVEGDDCDEVVEGIAIVTGLAIESMLAPEPSRGAAEQPAVEPEPPPPEPTEPPAPTRTPLAMAPPPGGWNHELAVSGGLRWGLGPAPAPMVGVRWAVGPPRRPDLVALRVEGADTTQVTEQDVQLRFRLIAARLESCPVVPAVGRRLLFPLCGGFELGFVAARGYENPPQIVEGKRDLVPWAAATLSPAIRVASRSLFAQLEPTLLILVPSWTYRVQERGPDVDVFVTPRVAACIAASVGARFP